MSKKNVTYVDACHFQTIMVASGLPYAEQKGWIKISGAKGRNVYVAKTKTVGRVDISGFVSPTEGTRMLDPESEAHGSVAQGLDFSLSQDEILIAFTDLLTHLATLPEAEPVKRTMKKKENAAVGWTLFSSDPAQEPDSLGTNDEA